MNTVSVQVDLSGFGISEQFSINVPETVEGVTFKDGDTFTPRNNKEKLALEKIAGQIEKHDEQLESGMHNKVNIDFLKAQIKKLQDDVELLKDKVRQNGVH